MRKLYLISIWVSVYATIVAVNGCSAINKIHLAHVEHMENVRFNETKRLLVEVLPPKLIEQCGYQISSAEKPKTIAVEYVVAKDNRYWRKVGQYNENLNEVEYQKGKTKILWHEYLHFFKAGATRMTNECLNEIQAYFGAEALRVKDENRQLKRKIYLLEHGVSR